MTTKIVAYHRVSTAKQGQSGLGLEAQQSTIAGYALSLGAEIVASYTEIESGKNNERPELLKALHRAKVTGSILVIAKMDRLSRNAAFLLTLRDSGVKFVAADMPVADLITVGIMAVVAQHEREAISKRTKEALQAAKARGIKLGNPNGAAPLLRAGKGNAAAVQAVKDKTNKHAEDLRPVIESMKASGLTSLGALAKALNERRMMTTPTKRGIWYKTSVKNLLNRLS